MFNKRSDQQSGLFGFPFFSNAPQQQRSQFDVRDTEEALIIEGKFEGFEKEHIRIEFVRNGILISAEKAPEKAADDGDEVPVRTNHVQRTERFIPVYFPFTENDVKASFSEENVLTVTVTKNKDNRKYISIE